MRVLNLPEMVQISDPDQVLEERIKHELALAFEAREGGKPEVATWHWGEFVRLIEERRPERVREMERARGIA